VRQADILSFKCPCCPLSTISTERQYFEHIGRHLKKQETVDCVFENCHFKSNIYGTFASHRSRKHTPHSLDDFKPELVQRYVNPLNVGDDPVEEDHEGGCDCPEEIDLPNLIEKYLSELLLKLESIYMVPQRCIDELVEEMHFISSSAAGPVLKYILKSCLEKHNCELSDVFISEIVAGLCERNSVSVATRSGGPLSTTYKRHKNFKRHFSMVEPVEYYHNARDGSSFQYVPILKTLSKLFEKKEIQDLFTQAGAEDTYIRHEVQYKSYRDGTNFQNNTLLSEDDPAISLILFVDDYEICNPIVHSLFRETDQRYSFFCCRR
jgi:hypothetical protein